ncbi:MAG: hypothetical protein ACFFDP_02570 [Promethearchaeota archaeon]
MRKYVSLAAVSLLVLSMILPLKFNTHAECESTVTDLIAGQHIDVGSVTVWNDGTFLYVKYSTADCWVLTETHLAVATSLEGIPQTSNDNPILGKFSYRTMHDPLVTEYTYVIDLDGWDAGTELYIAAHAVVLNEIAMTVVSDANTLVTAGNVPLATYPYNATYAWEPSTDTDPSYWDNSLVGHSFSASGADWIWESYRVVHPVDGDIVNFTRTFEIDDECFEINDESWFTALTDSSPWIPYCFPPEPLIDAILYITCDNAYEVYLNGEFVGNAQIEQAGWETSDLTEPWINGDDWQSVESYDVSNLILPGENILEVRGVNEYFGPLDDIYPGTKSTNPAGLIFELNIGSGSVQEETAWGDGEDFSWKNWAMYFTYTVCSP